MRPDRLLERIRAADPAPADAVTDDDLFARIVAQPGDSRLMAAATRTRHRRRRWLGLLAASAVLVGAGGAAGAISLGAFTHASPKALLEANPAGQFSRRPGKTGGDAQTVIPQSVHRATTFTVPGVGRFAWWIGLRRPSGWLCRRDPAAQRNLGRPRRGRRQQVPGRRAHARLRKPPMAR